MKGPVGHARATAQSDRQLSSMKVERPLSSMKVKLLRQYYMPQPGGGTIQAHGYFSQCPTLLAILFIVTNFTSFIRNRLCWQHPRFPWA